MRLLLTKSVDVNTATCSTAMQDAAERGYLEVTMLLLENGANINGGNDE